MKKTGFTLLILMMLSGCASSWTNIGTGKSAEKSRVSQALKECNYEKKRKLARLYFIQSKYGEGMSVEAKAKFKKMSDDKMKEINDCMKRKGFKR